MSEKNTTKTKSSKFGGIAYIFGLSSIFLYLFFVAFVLPCCQDYSVKKAKLDSETVTELESCQFHCEVDQVIALQQQGSIHLGDEVQIKDLSRQCFQRKFDCSLEHFWRQGWMTAYDHRHLEYYAEKAGLFFGDYPVIDELLWNHVGLIIEKNAKRELARHQQSCEESARHNIKSIKSADFSNGLDCGGLVTLFYENAKCSGKETSYYIDDDEFERILNEVDQCYPAAIRRIEEIKKVVAQY